jgi:hypothetical protein
MKTETFVAEFYGSNDGETWHRLGAGPVEAVPKGLRASCNFWPDLGIEPGGLEIIFDVEDPPERR